MLVDNIQHGFDLYRWDRTSIVRSFDTGVRRLWIKEVVFAESATLAVAGSDCGEVHIFEVATGEKLQSLRHGKRRFQVLSENIVVNILTRRRSGADGNGE
jgi:hypothetical protein